MRRYFRSKLPNPNDFANGPIVRILGPGVLHPGLWTLSRRSVAGAVAAGLFCGMLPAPFQTISAAVVALFLKVNLPLACLVTLYTNPLTMLPLYFLALRLGVFLFAELDLPLPGQASGLAQSSLPPPPDFHFMEPWASTLALVDWGLGLGWPLAVGVLALGSLFAVVGYLLIWTGWSFTVWRSRQRRLDARRVRVSSQADASDKS